MKMVSWNVRGLGGWEKRSKIKEFLLSCSPDIVLLQETKLQEVHAFDVSSFWGARCMDWMVLPSCGPLEVLLLFGTLGLRPK